MLVRDIMSTPVFIIASDTPVSEAQKLMQRRQIRHLPVRQDEHVVGIVSDREIRLNLPSPATSLSVFELRYLLQKLTVAEVMATRVITVAADDTSIEAAQRMLEHMIGALLVVEQEQEVGILTRSDLLRACIASQDGLLIPA